MYKLLTLCLCLCLSLATCDLNLPEGADCVWSVPGETDFQGKCVSPRRCLTTLARRDDEPPVCSKKGAETIICCTDCELTNDTSKIVFSPTGKFLTKDGRKARDYCLSNMNKYNECYGYYSGISRDWFKNEKCHRHSYWGIGGSPPLGGEPLSVNPYEALVGFGKDLKSVQWYTAGAIISDKYILTSALVDKPLMRGGKKFVAVGVKRLQDAAHKWKIHAVESVEVHPGVSRKIKYNYLALLKLEKPIEFNEDAYPACLPDGKADLDMSVGRITPFADPKMTVERFAETRRIFEEPLLKTEDCNEVLRSWDIPRGRASIALPRGVDEATQICYGDENMCGTVVGSPIVVNSYLDRCVNTVVGILVYGGDCEPAVFAKVAAYVPWIESIVWP